MARLFHAVFWDVMPALLPQMIPLLLDWPTVLLPQMIPSAHDCGSLHTRSLLPQMIPLLQTVELPQMIPDAQAV